MKKRWVLFDRYVEELQASLWKIKILQRHAFWENNSKCSKQKKNNEEKRFELCWSPQIDECPWWISLSKWVQGTFDPSIPERMKTHRRPWVQIKNRNFTWFARLGTSFIWPWFTFLDPLKWSRQSDGLLAVNCDDSNQMTFPGLIWLLRIPAFVEVIDDLSCSLESQRFDWLTWLAAWPLAQIYLNHTCS